ncbi:MAG TPA: type I-B CRISPR-associated protein Cas5b [bacterium]|nr:type I-B CRISPR-associated protein Cas5b [bacterium]HPP29786.1 type I-B CRISPR-associated protein Cas5b [bacterium]
MNFKRYLIFDVWGDYAHFKKYYTTSSPLTFSLPPRTAVIGLIGAILGYSKEDYLEEMIKDQAKIAIRILNPVKKVRLSINLINTKDGYWIPVKRSSHEPRTQMIFEFLKDPKFRIYFSHTDSEIYNRLKELLESHKCVYTPYLGISELIANYQFVKETEFDEIVSNCNYVHSVISIDKDVKVEFESGKRYFKEKIPIEMLKGRIVTEYKEVLFEATGQSIKAYNRNFLKLKNGEIIDIL